MFGISCNRSFRNLKETFALPAWKYHVLSHVWEFTFVSRCISRHFSLLVAAATCRDWHVTCVPIVQDLDFFSLLSLGFLTFATDTYKLMYILWASSASRPATPAPSPPPARNFATFSIQNRVSILWGIMWFCSYSYWNIYNECYWFPSLYIHTFWVDILRPSIWCISFYLIIQYFRCRKVVTLMCSHYLDFINRRESRAVGMSWVNGERRALLARSALIDSSVTT